jgi:hypothetical protein
VCCGFHQLGGDCETRRAQRCQSRDHQISAQRMLPFNPTAEGISSLQKVLRQIAARLPEPVALGRALVDHSGEKELQIVYLGYRPELSVNIGKETLKLHWLIASAFAAPSQPLDRLTLDSDQSSQDW